MPARAYTFTLSGNSVSLTTSDGEGDRNIPVPCLVREDPNGLLTIVESGEIVWQGYYTSITSINGSAPSSQDDARQKLAAIFKTQLSQPSTFADSLSLTTSATGSSFTAFGSATCSFMDIINNNSTAIEYLRSGESVNIPIPAYSSRMVIGITNANQISVRRVDQSNTQITIQSECFI